MGVFVLQATLLAVLAAAEREHCWVDLTAPHQATDGVFPLPVMLLSSRLLTACCSSRHTSTLQGLYGGAPGLYGGAPVL